MSDRLERINQAKNKQKYTEIDQTSNYNMDASTPPITSHEPRTSPEPIQAYQYLHTGNDNLKETINVLIIERNKLTKSLNDSALSINELKDLISKLSAENSQLSLQARQFKTSFETYTHELNQANLKVKSLETTLDNKHDQFISLEKNFQIQMREIDELKLKLNEKIEQCKSLQNVCSTLSSQNSTSVDGEDPELRLKLEEQLKEKNEIVDKFTAENQRIKTMLNSTVQHNEELTNQCSHFKRLIEDNTLIIDGLNKKNRQLQNQFDELKLLAKPNTENLILERKNKEFDILIEQKDVMINELMRRIENYDQIHHDRNRLIDKIKEDRQIISNCTSQNVQLKNILVQHQNTIIDLKRQLNLLSTTNDLSVKAPQKYQLLQYLNELNMISENFTTYSASLKLMSDNRKLELSDDSILSHYNELIETTKDLSTKNSHFKKVNSTLSETIDDQCDTIKLLNKTIVELKEQLSYLKMAPTINIAPEQFTQTFFDEKKVLETELASLKSQLNSSSPTKLKKTECYAELERKYERLKHEKSLIDCKYSDMLHKNILLTEECNNIGEYIQLYITQRTAMKIYIDSVFNYINDIRSRTHILYISFKSLHDYIQTKNISDAKYGSLYEEFLNCFIPLIYQISFNGSLDLLQRNDVYDVEPTWTDDFKARFSFYFTNS